MPALRERRWLRVLRRLLIGLAVLAVLLVGVDRLGVWIGERAVADQVAAELAANRVDSDRPDVTFDRVPFLTQVVTGRYESVSVRLRNVGQAGVRMPLVDLTASGVTASPSAVTSGSGAIDAERVEGTAVVDYASVVALTGYPDLRLSEGPDGLLALRMPTSLVGVPVVLVGTAEVVLTGQTLDIRVTDLTVEEPPLPPGADPIVDRLADELSVEVALPTLPYGLTVDSVEPGETGLEARVSARDVPLAR